MIPLTLFLSWLFDQRILDGGRQNAPLPNFYIGDHNAPNLVRDLLVTKIFGKFCFELMTLS